MSDVFVYEHSLLAMLREEMLQQRMCDQDMWPQTAAAVKHARSVMRSQVAGYFAAAELRRNESSERLQTVFNNVSLERCDVAFCSLLPHAGSLVHVGLEWLLALPNFLSEVQKKMDAKKITFERPLQARVNNRGNYVSLSHEFDFVAALTNANLITVQRDERLDTVFVRMDVGLSPLLLSPRLGDDNFRPSDARAWVGATQICVGFKWTHCVPALLEQFNELSGSVEVCEHVVLL